MEEALLQLGAVLKGRVQLFVFSDFHDPLPLMPLAQAALRHDIISVMVSDPIEWDLPSAGLINTLDPETGGESILDSSDSFVRETYRHLAADRHVQIRQQLAVAGTEILNLSTSLDPLYPLIRFFRTRSLKRRC
jgi:hypothetical protein